MTALSTLFPCGLSLSLGEVLLAVELGAEEAGVDVLRALLGPAIAVHARRPGGHISASSDIAEKVPRDERPALVDCVHALRYACDVRDPAALLKNLAHAAAGAAAVVPAMSPVYTPRLLRGARHVVVIDGLASGAARDVHGTVQVVKRDGRWRRNGAEGVYRFRVREDGRVDVFR